MIVGVLAAKTAVVMLFLYLWFRLLGKRQVGQLNLYDLAMIMAVSNAVQNAMTQGRGDLSVGLAVSSTVILVAWALSRAFVAAPGLETRVIGSPTLLLNDGRMLREPMRRERVTEDELMESLRVHGYSSPNQLRMAVLEVDGSISIVPKS